MTSEENVHAIGRVSEVDRGYEAQKAAEAHLEAVWEAEEEFDEALEASEKNGLLDELPGSPAIGPWDGCTTCTVREVLWAGWPFAEQAVIDEVRRLGLVDLADQLDETCGLNARSKSNPESGGRV